MLGHYGILSVIISQAWLFSMSPNMEDIKGDVGWIVSSSRWIIYAPPEASILHRNPVFGADGIGTSSQTGSVRAMSFRHAYIVDMLKSGKDVQ